MIEAQNVQSPESAVISGDEVSSHRVTVRKMRGSPWAFVTLTEIPVCDPFAEHNDEVTDYNDSQTAQLGTVDEREWGNSACRSRYGTFSECQLCGGPLTPEHAHFKCRACGWRDSCCD